MFDGWRGNSAASRWLVNSTLVSPVSATTQLGVFLMATDNSFNIPGPLTQLQVDQDPLQANPTYLARLVRSMGLTVTRLASGLPVGGDLEYADEVTLGRAFEGRRPVDV